MSTLFGELPCVDPKALKESCDANGIPTGAWYGKANAFHLAAGRMPGRGHVLLRKSDIDALALTTDHTLTFSGEDTSHVVTFSPVTLIRFECATPGAEEDPNAVYLCELVDRRHFLARVPMPGGYAGYNVTNAAGDDYQTATLNSSVAWTWQEVVDDLVGILGEDPAEFVLPFTPDGTPENLAFDCSPWEALNRVLDRLACAPVLDPTTDTFAVVRLGEDAGASVVAMEDAAEYKGRTWDGYAGEPERGWRPEKVRVRFPRRPQVVTTTGATPYYTVDVTLAATSGVVAGSYVVVDDDATAEGATGTPTNSAALATRATERADDWLRARQGDEAFVRGWRDFQALAIAAVGRTVSRVTFDDRGGAMRTWAATEPGGGLERFKPLGDWPAWWPLATDPALGADLSYYRHAESSGTLGTYAPGGIITGNFPSNVTVPADQMHVVALVVAQAITLDRLAVNVGVAAAGGSTARLAIYDTAPGGKDTWPRTLLVDTGAFGIDSTGAKSQTVSLTLPAGLYWLCYLGSASAQIKGTTDVFMWPIFGVSDALAQYMGLRFTYSYGAFPASFPAKNASYLASGSFVIPFVRIAS